MKQLFEELEKSPVIYVTRDIERALGIPLDTPGYFIIANSTPFAKQVATDRDNVFLIDDKKLIDTWDLLKRDDVAAFINKINDARLIVFKNTKQIEKTCSENEWKLLNPASSISDTVEPKISQIEWLSELTRYLPEYTVAACKDVEWKGEQFILQFNRSHTGSGTMLIIGEEQLDEIKKKFPERPVRTASYVIGPLFTNNNCVTKEDVLIGNISYQITGLEPFTDRAFATIGNDWSIPCCILNDEQRKKYAEIATAVGEKLRSSGWKGLFGIDVVVDEKTEELYLLEINCRQPASTSFEAFLQKEVDSLKLTVMEAHLATLLNIDFEDEELTKINMGAQIILRNKNLAVKYDFNLLERKLGECKCVLTRYENTEPGTDLLRIQHTEGLMSDHNKFNDLGETISNAIHNC